MGPTAHVRLTNATGGAFVMQPVFIVSNHAIGINIGYQSVGAGATVGFSGSCIVDMDAADTATVRYYGGGNCTLGLAAMITLTQPGAHSEGRLD